MASSHCHKLSSISGRLRYILHYLDYETLSKQLVRALRGSRSQGATNRKLRRTSNVLHTWERGTRHPRASDFFALAGLAKVDLPRAFAGLGVTADGAAREGELTLRLLTALARGRTHAEVARLVERDRNTVARWFEGTTEPRLPDLLRLVEALSLRLVDFLSSFVDPEQIPAIRGAHRTLALQRRLAYDLPWAHAVLRVLELDAYRRLPAHEPGLIARLIGIDLAEEERCLSALAEAGQIRKRKGKWGVVSVTTVDTREDATRNAALKLHWARTGLERLERGALEGGALFSYNLFAISDEGLEQIRRAHLDYFARLRSIVSECRDPTRLVLANVQLVPLETGRDGRAAPRTPGRQRG